MARVAFLDSDSDYKNAFPLHQCLHSILLSGVTKRCHIDIRCPQHPCLGALDHGEAGRERVSWLGMMISD